MAPELLEGGSPKKPCDIYAFGMTVFEVNWCSQTVAITKELSRFLQTKFRWVTLTMVIFSHLLLSEMSDRNDQTTMMYPNYQTLYGNWLRNVG